MKKVVDTDQVAHLWANKLQSEARNKQGNLFFDGDTIYSYGRHFPIAKHVTVNGTDAVLFTTRSYSNTTAKHLHIVRHACNHLNVIYCYNPLVYGIDHTENFNDWLHDAENTAFKLQGARKPEKYLNELHRIAGQVVTYANFFSVPIPEKLNAVLSIENGPQYVEYINAKDALLKKEEQARERARLKDHKKALTKWLKGETHRLYDHDGFDYIRMNKDNTEVETTQGLKFPAEACKKMWERLKDGNIVVGDHFFKYPISETGKLLKIGCHTFKTDYLLKWGQNHFGEVCA